MAASAAHTTALRSVITAAKRRRLLVALLAELPLALSIVLAAAIILLLAGTLFFHGSWLLALSGLLLVALAVRVVRSRIDPYRLAQILDSRLQLQDSLSTAWFLLHQPANGKVNPVHAAWQLESATRQAQTVRPEQAFPLTGSRRWFIPLALLAAVLALFALRYARTSTLDLRASLLPIEVSRFFSPAAKAEEREPPAPRRASNRFERKLQAGQPTPFGESFPQGQPVPSPASNAASANSLAGGASAQSSLERLQKQLGGQQSQTGKEPGTVRRMADAVSGLMSKLQQTVKPNRPAPEKTGSQAQTQAQESGQPGPPQNRTEDKKSGQQQGSKAEDQQATASDAKAVEKTNTGQTGNSAQPSRDAGANAQSGAGRNDGRKDVLDAQQLRALGKLSEIIGKRSASVSGEMTVEKSSSKQQLSTEYSNQLGVHADRGAALHRNEIPDVYRDYVRAYMEAVRKPTTAQP